MRPYYELRRVSYICFHANRGKTWEQIVAMAIKARVASTREQMEVCREDGYQSVRNADLLRDELNRRRAASKEAQEAGLPPPVFPPLRLSDIGGCRLPGG
jgi:hypothetical protein